MRKMKHLPPNEREVTKMTRLTYELANGTTTADYQKALNSGMRFKEVFTTVPEDMGKPIGGKRGKALAQFGVVSSKTLAMVD